MYFGTKFARKELLNSKREKENIANEFCIFELNLGTNFQLKLAIPMFWDKYAQAGYFQSKTEKNIITNKF